MTDKAVSALTSLTGATTATGDLLYIVDISEAAAADRSKKITAQELQNYLKKFPATIGVGNATPAASGAGVSFPATQSASSDGNTLDDYEEGTWQPNMTFASGLTGSFTLTQNDGFYVKVGRLVHIQVFITWSAKPSAGTALQISLPFTAISGNEYRGGFGIGYIDSGSFSLTAYQIALRHEAGAARAVFNYSDAADGIINSGIDVTGVGTAGGVMIFGSFVADA